MKKLAALAMTLLMVMGLAACNGSDPISAIASKIKGDVTGEVEGLYQTQWFDFKVNSLETMETYKEVTADEGYVFLVANVYEKNTWDGDDMIPMSHYDFYALEGTDTTKIWAEDPWDDAMMPDEFWLDPEEEATYDVVFMVSEDVADVSFVYVEVDENEDTYATFTIKHTL